MRRCPVHTGCFNAVLSMGSFGSDLTLVERRHRYRAKTQRPTIQKHCASATLGDPAAELRAGHSKHVAQHPEERRVAVDIDRPIGTVALDCDAHAYLQPLP